ncbi:PspA-associated protein PspAB [Actinacidiphila sp. bgisy160]|uniref:PspA-associated protein PspAB n=1 Tax=Actinacidiphila sp. bgisy160 TaxID=3413796 RepID=UPI003D712D4C
MGFLDALLGRSKPVRPDLDQLFGLPSAAVTLEAAAGFRPTGVGSVCFAAVEGGAFAEVQQDVRALLDMDTGQGAVPVEPVRDAYGYTWLVVRRPAQDLPVLVGDLHAVNSALEGHGYGPQLLCSLAAFRDDAGRTLALVYLYKRGSFYPFAPLPGEKRDNPLELQVKALLGDDLRLEEDLGRWFPLWGAPGLGG